MAELHFPDFWLLPLFGIINLEHLEKFKKLETERSLVEAAEI